MNRLIQIVKDSGFVPVIGNILVILVLISCLEKRIPLSEAEVLPEEKIIMYKGKPFTGIIYSMHTNDCMEMESYVKDGKRDGLARGWYENGQLESETNFSQDEYDGSHQGWYKNGQLKVEANFKDGKMEGLVKRWDQNGQIALEEIYKEGELIEKIK